MDATGLTFICFAVVSLSIKELVSTRAGLTCSGAGDRVWGNGTKADGRGIGASALRSQGSNPAGTGDGLRDFGPFLGFAPSRSVERTLEGETVPSPSSANLDDAGGAST